MDKQEKQLLVARTFRVAAWVGLFASTAVMVHNLAARATKYDSWHPVIVPWSVLVAIALASFVLAVIATPLPLAIVAGHPNWAWRNTQRLGVFAKKGPQTLELVRRSWWKLVAGTLVMLASMLGFLWIEYVLVRPILFAIHIAAVAFIFEAGPFGLRERMMRSQTSGGQELHGGTGGL